jgi:spore coat polysaccharide biosynthesis protein SpsF (cytidylyltransferase family)
MTLGVIQARLGSSRFPRKVLADLQGKPVIQHVVDRARQIRGLDALVLACPAPDAETFETVLGASIRVQGVDGPEDDVLARFAAVVAGYPDADVVMRLTGDCPLLNPRVCEQVLGQYLVTHTLSSVDYVWNVADGYVDGEDCEVFSRDLFVRAVGCATDPQDREHVTPWMRRHGHVSTVFPLRGRHGEKTSIDTPADLERIRLK